MAISSKNILKILGYFAILITIVPLFAVDYWWIRIFDFPHVQLTFITALAILIYFIKFDFKNFGDYIFVVILVGCFAFQFIKFYPYTLFSNEDMLSSSSHVTDHISFLTSNVYQDNEDMTKVLTSIEQTNADIIVFTEVNERWHKTITKKFSHDYTYKFEYPLENTYGMSIYSKFELIQPKVEFLVKDDIPSIHCKVLTKLGDTIQMHAIHPTPPAPAHNPMSSDRDAEMMIVAKRVLNTKLPTIVIGDFNDVPWSETTTLFKRISKTLDPRIGRGLLSTYNAQQFLLRWPLDHMYCTDEFRLNKIKIIQETSSDHFPMYAEFTIEPEIAHQQSAELPSKQDLKRADNQIRKE